MDWAEKMWEHSTALGTTLQLHFNALNLFDQNSSCLLALLSSHCSAVRNNVRLVLVDTGERVRWAPKMEMDRTLQQKIPNGTHQISSGVVFTLSQNIPTLVCCVFGFFGAIFLVSGCNTIRGKIRCSRQKYGQGGFRSGIICYVESALR